MALNEVGLLVYSQGFAMSGDEYIIRELAFCDWTGQHHALLKYQLPKGVSYNPLSEEAKTRVDRQTRTVHGLPFEQYTAYNRHEFHPYHQIKDDITRWCQQYLTAKRGRLGVFTLNGLYRWTRMSNDYVTCMVIRVWSSSQPVALEPSPSRP